MTAVATPATPTRPQPRRAPAKSQPRLLVAYYGDDFTGSTDVMEALATAGVRTVLFLKPPTPKELAAFPGLRAFGVAGSSRTMSPREMDRSLPTIFRALHRSGAAIVHYKVCPREIYFRRCPSTVSKKSSLPTCPPLNTISRPFTAGLSE